MMKQKIFDEVYQNSKNKGFSAEDALKIAKKSINDLVVGKKSFSMSSYDVTNDRVLDVLVGYPDIDTEYKFGGRLLDPNGWYKIPDTQLTADINHYTFDAANGVRNDLDDKWKDFSAIFKDWYITDDGLRAKVFVPETEIGDEFINEYKNGKYGVSVEYIGKEKDNVIYDWDITGVSFHTDPSYIKTKTNYKNG